MKYVFLHENIVSDKTLKGAMMNWVENYVKSVTKYWLC